MHKLWKEFWESFHKNSVLNRVGSSTEKTVLETHSVLPLRATGKTVIMDYGKGGTQRICSQESGLWRQSTSDFHI